MRIIVFNVPATDSGALNVLKSFYSEILSEKIDGNEWVFVLGNIKLKDSSNIKVLNYSWVKKSILHRVFFDFVYAPLLVKKLKADCIISLQNSHIPFVKERQIIYVHNAIPFGDYKETYDKEIKFLISKFLLKIRLKKTLKRSKQIIVQTEWMKMKVMEIAKKSPNISVAIPTIESKKTNSKIYINESDKKKVIFFYPASGFSYKNHRVIIDACRKIDRKNFNDFKIVFTLNGNESKKIRLLKKICEIEKLPIEFIGNLQKEEIIKYYKTSILIFASRIESYGLPLLEARELNTTIISSDIKTSREILRKYEKVTYFQKENFVELQLLIENHIITSRKRRKYEQDGIELFEDYEIKTNILEEITL